MYASNSHEASECILCAIRATNVIFPYTGMAVETGGNLKFSIRIGAIELTDMRFASFISAERATE